MNNIELGHWLTGCDNCLFHAITFQVIFWYRQLSLPVSQCPNSMLFIQRLQRKTLSTCGLFDKVSWSIPSTTHGTGKLAHLGVTQLSHQRISSSESTFQRLSP